MQQLSLSVLGSFRVSLNQQPIVRFSAKKAQALLIYLILEPEKTYDRSVIAEFFWPEKTEKAARNSLRQAIHQLNRAIPSADKTRPFLNLSRQRIQFNGNSAYQVDALTFTNLIQQNQKHTHENITTCSACIGRLEEAVSLYQGDFLEQFTLSGSGAFELWLLGRQEWYRRRALTCLHTLTTYFQANNLEIAQQYGQRILEIDSLDEHGQQMMLAILAKRGQRGVALAQYERYRISLADNLGIAPSTKTKAVFDAIRHNQLTPDPPPSAIKAQSQPRRPPAPVRNFIGRAIELQELAKLTSDPSCRLLTIVGSHGVGKSALIRTVVRQQWMQFEHRCCLLKMKGVDSLGAFYQLLGRKLGLSNNADRKIVQRHLSDQQLLLALDGFDSLVMPTDELLYLLRIAPGLKIMVASRCRLQVSGEWVYDIGSLPKIDAAALFTQCAQQSNTHFSPTAVSQQTIRQICQLLQGNPLLIEAAAAWLRLTSCTTLLEELETNLYLLSDSWENEYETLWAELSDQEQNNLQKLSVFRGGFSRAIGHRVADISLPVIAKLSNRALLDYHPENDRYEIPELLRQFAAKKLGENGRLHDQIWKRHNRVYAEFLAAQAPRLHNHEQLDAITALQEEFPNIKQAWRWAIHIGDETLISQSATAIVRFCDMDERLEEGLRLLQAVRKKFPGQSSLLNGHLLTGSGLLAYRSGDLESAHQFITDGCALLTQATEPQQILAFAYQALIFQAVGDLDEAHRIVQKSLTLSSAHGDAFSASEALLVAGLLAYRQGEMEQAQQILQQSIMIKRVIGDLWGTAHCQDVLGDVAAAQNDIQTAVQRFAEALNVWRTFNNQQRSFDILMKLGRWEQRSEWYIQGIMLANKCQDQSMHLSAQYKLASLYRHQKAYKQATPAYQAAFDLAIQQQEIQETKTILYEIKNFLSELQQQEDNVASSDMIISLETAVSSHAMASL